MYILLNLPTSANEEMSEASLIQVVEVIPTLRIWIAEQYHQIKV